MAKVKEQGKSMEQRLEEALVLYEKTPYNLPSNWCWTRLPFLVQIKTGKKDANYAKENGQYRFYTCSTEYSMTDTYSFEGESIIVPGNGDIGLVFYYNGKFEAYQRTYVINGFEGETKYLYFYFYYKWREQNTYKQFGTAIPYVRMSNFEEFEIPLAPLEEQKRIVEVIEKQFAKLDEARDLIQKSLDSFSDRKSAILHQAFTGELTKKWRICNNIDLKSWKTIKLGQLGVLERGKSKHRPRNDPKLFGGKYPFVQTGDIANATKYISYHKQTLSEVGLQQSKLFSKGTLCITIAANIGDVAILAYDCCFPDSVVGFTPYKEVSSEFIYYKMKTLQGDLEANAPATAQKNINLKILNNINIFMPTLEEQEEIVRILDSIFEKEDRSKELIDILEKIDEMKKSILARAFRGELGTNNPTDEPAIELLRKTLKNDIYAAKPLIKEPKTTISFDYKKLKNNLEIEVIKEIVKKGGDVSTDYFN